MKDWLSETSLCGNIVTLLPMNKSHAEALASAASDGELWNLWYTSVPQKSEFDTYIDFALAEKEQDRALPFVVAENQSGKIVGSTRFCNANMQNKRLEIGYTWYSRSYQRTAVNTECKQLLLTHAFENLGCIAVEFRTHWHNLASRAAIARLGAKQDGVLRNFQKDAHGAYVDKVVFSIIDCEWPTVKQSLVFQLELSTR